MPHIVIEYSDNLEAEIKNSDLLKKIHQVVLDSGMFSPDAVKARSTAYSDFVMTDHANNFIHTTVSILSGRSTEQRKILSGAVFQAVLSAMPKADKVSVDIREMDAEVYRK